MASRPFIQLFYGDDRPLLYRKFDELQITLQKEIPDLQVCSFDEISMPEILDFVHTGSLFGTKFCIKVSKIKGKHSFSLWEGIAHFLLIHSPDETDPYTNVSLPFLEKRPCLLPKPWELVKILRQSFGETLSPDGLEYLSSNLSSILEIEELEKQRQFYNIPKLDLDHLSALLPDEKTNDFLLAEYFFDPGKVSLFFLTLHKLQTQLSSLEGFWNVLFRKTQNFIQIRQGLENRQSLNLLAKELKIHPFVLERTLPIARSYSLVQLKLLAQKILNGQYESRFYASKMDKILVTRLFFEKSSLGK